MQKVLRKLKQKKFELIFLIVTLIALVIRLLFFNEESGDYKCFLEKWFNEIKSNGGMLALKEGLDNCDYNFPYLIILALLTYLPINSLYSIKLVSVIFDIILAFASMILVNKLVTKNNKIYRIVTYTLVLFLPTVILNSAHWGQCDSIYTAFVLFALIMLIDKKYFKSCLFLGTALSFKIQAMFIIPLYALIILSDKKLMKKLYYVLLIPLVNIVLSLPVIIMRKNILCAFEAYVTQMGKYNNWIVANFPNIYNLICKSNMGEYLLSDFYIQLPKIMIAILAVLYLITSIAFIKNHVKIEEKKIVLIALWSVVLSTYLLPYMHDRYLYMGDILSIIFFLVYHDSKEKEAKNILVPLGIQGCSIFSYQIYLSEYSTYIMDKRIVSLIGLAVLMILTINIVRICRESRKEYEEIKERKITS